MEQIIIDTIDANQQRYPTCGDYFDKDGKKYFKITKQVSEDYEFLISIHEQVEEYLTRKKGIKEQDILAYDLNWEKKFQKGLTEAEEPGDEPDCIYRREHVIATIVEGILALELGIDFEKYDDEIIY